MEKDLDLVDTLGPFMTTKSVRKILFVSYLVVAITCTYSIFIPPFSMDLLWDEQTMKVIAALAAGGGLVGVCSTLQGWWFIEKWGALAVFLAGVIFEFLVVILHFTAGTTDLLKTGFVFLGLGMLVNRMTKIWNRPIDPTLSRHTSELETLGSDIEGGGVSEFK